MYQLTFKINLLPPKDFVPLANSSEIITQRSIYLPGLNGERILKHGDTFTAYNEDAIYLRNLARKTGENRIFELEILTETVVSNEYLWALTSSSPISLEESSLFEIDHLTGEYNYLNQIIENYGRFDNNRLSWHPIEKRLYTIHRYYETEDGNSVVRFGKLNLETSELTLIELTATEEIMNDLDNYVASITYYDDSFLVLSNNNIVYEITPNGNVSIFVPLNDSYQRVIYENGLLLGTNNNEIHVINPESGFREEGEGGEGGTFSIGVRLRLDSDPETSSVREIISLISSGEDSYHILFIQQGYEEGDLTNYLLVDMNLTFEPLENETQIIADNTIQTFESSNLNLVEYDGSDVLISLSPEEVTTGDDIKADTIYTALPPDLVEIYTFGSRLYNDYSAITFNYDDGYLYALLHKCNESEITDDPDEDPVCQLVLKKINVNNFEETDLELEGIVNVRGISVNTSGAYINDGGHDMYDDGNIIATNLSDIPVLYTHTRQSNDSDRVIEDFTFDGEIDSGKIWFGEQSIYFTNCYPGLFVLSASEIDINTFGIYGELGADGSGKAEKNDFEITQSDTTYKVFFKKVYDSGDPSVNHLIIVPKNNNEMIHTISTNTDNDFDQIENLENVDKIHYLLFAKNDEDGGENSLDTEISLEEAQAIAQQYISMMHGKNLTEILVELNNNYTSITELIPNLFLFSDEGNDEDSEYIRNLEGIVEPNCMIYSGNNELLVGDNQYGFFKITLSGNTGVVSALGNNNDINGMAYHNETLYGIDDDNDRLAIIDPETGDFVGGGGEGGAGVDITYEGNIVDLQTIASINGKLYGKIYISAEGIEEGEYLAEIDVETGTCQLINIFPNNNNLRDFTTVVK